MQSPVRAARTALAAALVATALTTSLYAADDDLVPAGSINGVFGFKPTVFIAEADSAAVPQAKWVRERFMADATLMLDADAARADLAGHNLIVYGTLDGNAWLKAHAERLPFTMADGVVELAGRQFRGEHLRVICAVRNPQDTERRALLYVTGDAADLRNINNVFHGPTGWVVADGDRVLASGDFRGPALTKAAMADDLGEMVARMREIHPATVDGFTPEMEDAIAQARMAVAEGVDEETFWKLLNGIILLLGDSHSHMRAGPEERIDLPVAWLDEGPVVTRDTGQLRRGDLVVAIGGEWPADLHEGIEGLIASENAWHTRHLAERVLTDTQVLRAIGATWKPPVPVRVERGGTIMDVEVSEAHGRPPRQHKRWVRCVIEPEHDLGVFTLDRCVNDETYRSTLAEFFETVAEQGIGRIAVDLRENGGGNSSVTNEFLRYIDVAAYADFSAAIRISPYLIEQGRYGGKPRFDRYGPQRKTNRRVESPKPFTGKIYVLTSRHSFSSATWFATVLSDNDLATIVGEPCGGKPSHYGDIVELTLSKSGIAYTLSHKNFIRPARDRDPASALMPDIPIPMTRAAIIAGTDPVLDHLRGLGGK